MKIFSSNSNNDSPPIRDNNQNITVGSKKITAIKAQVKNDNRVSIFLDGKYSFSLTLDQLLELKLKKGDEVDENQVKEYKKLSDEGKVRQRALEWLMGRPHSTRELRDYLYRKKVDKDFLEQLVTDFTSKKYLNDVDFARWFADNRRRKNKSNRAIFAELRAKGISSQDIEPVINSLETDDMQALKMLIEKIKDRPRYQDIQKLKSYLVSKGFSYSLIKQALEE